MLFRLSKPVKSSLNRAVFFVKTGGKPSIHLFEEA
jgi:hypothetical protein